jgi:hypothetical protein
LDTGSFWEQNMTAQPIQAELKTVPLNLADQQDERATLELRKTDLENRIRSRRDIHNVFLIASLILVVGVVLTIVYVAIRASALTIEDENLLLGLVVVFAVIFPIPFVIFLFINSRVVGLTNELASTETSLRIAKNFGSTDAGAGTTYFDSLVKINVENLGEYYSLVKLHTSNSFRAAIAAGVLGFVFILLGLGLGLVREGNTQTVAIISTAAGIITNFISAIFFYLYNRTVQQLKSYHDSLLNVQNIMLSFKIIGDLQSADTKAAMMSKMITYLIGQKPGNEGLPLPADDPGTSTTGGVG